MKKLSIFIIFLLSVFVAQAQFSVNSSGKASVGTYQYQANLPDFPDTEINPLAIVNPLPTSGDTTAMLNIYGVYGNANCGGFINFGKNESYSRVKIGELGTTDTDKLWLHGRKGMYLTALTSDTICYYDNEKDDSFHFNCDVSTTGVFVTSDKRLKQNIKYLGHSIDELKMISPISYRLNTRGRNVSATGDENDLLAEQLETKRKTSNSRYGFIAQEVQEVFPELVKTDADGYLSVDYIGFIPLLVDAVNELKAITAEQEETIAILTSQLEETQNAGPSRIGKSRETAGIDNELVTDEARLYQNTPNPFSSTTQIRYELPEEVATADIRIYDMQGKQLHRIAITERGCGTVSIEAEGEEPGMYLYTLIADGQEIDTKRMILTD